MRGRVLVVWDDHVDFWVVLEGSEPPTVVFQMGDLDVEARARANVVIVRVVDVGWIFLVVAVTAALDVDDSIGRDVDLETSTVVALGTVLLGVVIVGLKEVCALVEGVV